MASENETQTYFGRCRCCLNYGYLKNMWIQYGDEENTEVYGEMLINCFALSWDATEDTLELDQICDDCITRLRDASSFKQLVLKSQEELLEECTDTKKICVDSELIVPDPSEEDGLYVVYKAAETDTGDRNKTSGDDPMGDDSKTTGDDSKMKGDETKVEADDGDDSVENVMDFEEIEFLEDDIDTDAKDEKKPKRNPKWPRKLPKDRRYQTYKQYSNQDLRNAFEDIKKGMHIAEACSRYNIPRKTLHSKIRELEENPDLSRFDKLAKDVKLILTYTNATPFKSKTNKYFCAYCGTDSANFEEPCALREHTRARHAGERISRVELMLRPYFNNEILRLDIDRLACTVCVVPLPSWNHMFQHLQTEHNIKLDEAPYRVVPFSLQADQKCTLCNQVFRNFMHLDGHMNTHYSNYMCGDCGDSFLTSNRMKHHMKSHETGRFACNYCSKVFTMLKYRQKHVEMIHKRMSKMKCHYCGEKFSGEYERHNHVLEKHSDKVKSITCELCGRTFTMRSRYTTHMRKFHKQPNKPYMCTICGETFTLKKLLTEHKLTHVSKKNTKYLCMKCKKSYDSVAEFEKHLTEHVNDAELKQKPES